jgi:hypothetical protein
LVDVAVAAVAPMMILLAIHGKLAIARHSKTKVPKRLSGVFDYCHCRHNHHLPDRNNWLLLLLLLWSSVWELEAQLTQQGVVGFYCRLGCCGGCLGILQQLHTGFPVDTT